MSDKLERKPPLVFMTTQGPGNYFTMYCSNCNQPWIFNKQVIIYGLPKDDWVCPYCRRGWTFKETEEPNE